MAFASFSLDSLDLTQYQRNACERGESRFSFLLPYPLLPSDIVFTRNVTLAESLQHIQRHRRSPRDLHVIIIHLGTECKVEADLSQVNIYNAHSLLLPAPSDLNRKFRFPSLQPALSLIHDVSLAIRPTISTVDELLGPGIDEEGNIEDSAIGERGDWLGTGDTGLDEILGGGLRIGSLMEITGER